jgi:asparaginyl-tRNA synthetase
MKRNKIAELLKTTAQEQEVIVMGWVRSFRNNQFIALNDGSTINNLQVVVDFTKLDETTLKRITPGACISAKGKLIASQGKGQASEVVCENLEILGDCDGEKFPLQL